MNGVPSTKWWRLSIPTTLSASRFVLAGIFPLLADRGQIVVVLLAAISDWLDGVAARRLRCTRWWGGFLDAASDKFFTLVVMISLTVEGSLAVWQLALLLVRDAAVALAVGRMLAGRQWRRLRRFHSLLLGKATTVGLFALALVVLLWPAARGVHIALTLATALLSMLAARDYWQRYKETSDENGEPQACVNPGEP